METKYACYYIAHLRLLYIFLYAGLTIMSNSGRS